MSAFEPRALLKGTEGLVSLPDVFLRINALVNEEDASFRKIGDVLVLDPALSARLLRVVNSPYYGHAGRITTISRAMSVIGLKDFYHLLLGTCAADMFRRIPYDLVNMGDFWVHSVYCAAIARLLARHADVLHVERFFVAGLLHQVGSLVIFDQRPDESREMLTELQGRFWRLGEVEKRRWGFTYADVGGELARQWSLPKSLCSMIACHLSPLEAEEDLLLDALLLHAAHRLKNHLFENELPVEAMVEDCRACLGELISIEDDLIRDVLAVAPEQAKEAMHLLRPK